MPNYQNGKIYRIVCNKTGRQYIGSTTLRLLTQRLAEHVHAYKRFNDGKTGIYVRSFDIIKEKDYDIILIENYPSDSKEELHKRERHYIETLDCVNKNIPTQTREEYHKKYYIKNKDKIDAYKKEWRKKNRHKPTVIESDRKKCKKYYYKNKDKMRERAKTYRLKHLDTIKAKRQIKYDCICGGRYSCASKSMHNKTNKHIEFMNRFNSKDMEISFSAIKELHERRHKH